MTRLDWSDPEAVRRWLADLRVAYEDAASVPRDMLRPLRQRHLGPAEAQRLFDEANGKMLDLLKYAAPAPDDVDAGSGRAS